MRSGGQPTTLVVAGNGSELRLGPREAPRRPELDGQRRDDRRALRRRRDLGVGMDPHQRRIAGEPLHRPGGTPTPAVDDGADQEQQRHDGGPAGHGPDPPAGRQEIVLAPPPVGPLVRKLLGVVREAVVVDQRSDYYRHGHKGKQQVTERGCSPLGLKEKHSPMLETWPDLAHRAQLLAARRTPAPKVNIKFWRGAEDNQRSVRRPGDSQNPREFPHCFTP